jgi:hypothetical protein
MQVISYKKFGTISSKLIVPNLPKKKEARAASFNH